MEVFRFAGAARAPHVVVTVTRRLLVHCVRAIWESPSFPFLVKDS